MWSVFVFLPKVNTLSFFFRTSFFPHLHIIIFLRRYWIFIISILLIILCLKISFWTIEYFKIFLTIERWSKFIDLNIWERKKGVWVVQVIFTNRSNLTSPLFLFSRKQSYKRNLDFKRVWISLNFGPNYCCCELFDVILPLNKSKLVLTLKQTTFAVSYLR